MDWEDYSPLLQLLVPLLPVLITTSKQREFNRQRKTGGGEDFDEFDIFDDEDLNDDYSDSISSAADDEHDEAQAHAKGSDMHSSEEHTSDKQGNGRSYVSLDLKKAKEKADALFNDVSEKVEDTVQKIKSSEEYETLSSKVDEAVTKIKNSEEFENVTTKINDTVERIKNSNEYANVDEQMESALNKVKEATEKAVSKVGEKLTLLWAQRKI